MKFCFHTRRVLPHTLRNKAPHTDFSALESMSGLSVIIKCSNIILRSRSCTTTCWSSSHLQCVRPFVRSKGQPIIGMDKYTAMWEFLFTFLAVTLSFQRWSGTYKNTTRTKSLHPHAGSVCQAESPFPLMVQLSCHLYYNSLTASHMKSCQTLWVCVE